MGVDRVVQVERGCRTTGCSADGQEVTNGELSLSLNSGPQACAASSLPAELSLHSSGVYSTVQLSSCLSCSEHKSLQLNKYQ